MHPARSLQPSAKRSASGVRRADSSRCAGKSTAHCAKLDLTVQQQPPRLSRAPEGLLAGRKASPVQISVCR